MQKLLKYCGASAVAMTMITTAAFAQGAATADGIFTGEQATRGIEVYQMNCSGCHGSELTGSPGGPGIAGARFKVKWQKKSVGEFYTKIVETMPAGLGGSLPEQEYLDVTAYILQVNKFAAGDTEMTADVEALNAITIGAPAN